MCRTIGTDSSHFACEKGRAEIAMALMNRANINIGQ
jgi:hypothetical protein